MKYYMTEDSLVYILRLLKEKNSDMFISKNEYNEDIVNFVVDSEALMVMLNEVFDTTKA